MMENERGFVLKINGQYVSTILANGHPEKPVVYMTARIGEAKTWKQPGAVRKARARIGKGGHILLYEVHEGCRVLIGMLGKDKDEPVTLDMADDYDQKRHSGLIEEGES